MGAVFIRPRRRRHRHFSSKSLNCWQNKNKNRTKRRKKNHNRASLLMDNFIKKKKDGKEICDLMYNLCPFDRISHIIPAVKLHLVQSLFQRVFKTLQYINA